VKLKNIILRGVLFDLDGTIVDSKQAYFEAAKVAFNTFGLKPPEMQKALEIPRRLERGMPLSDIINSDVDKFLDVYLKTYYSVTKFRSKPIPGIQDTLRLLSTKAKLALITMRFVQKTSVVNELQQFGIARYFAYVVTALDTLKPKPSPEALIKTVEALDVNLCDCVFVGDSVTDIQAGKAAGAFTVAVLSGLFSGDELAGEKPDLILKDATQLPVFLGFGN